MRFNLLLLIYFPNVALFLIADRSVMLWKLKLGNLDKNVVELNMKDIRTVRTVVQYDTASLVRWSPDSKALLIVRALGNNIEIYKVTKKPDGDMPCVQASHEFPKVAKFVTLIVLSVVMCSLRTDQGNGPDDDRCSEYRPVHPYVHAEERAGHPRFKRQHPIVDRYERDGNLLRQNLA